MYDWKQAAQQNTPHLTSLLGLASPGHLMLFALARLAVKPQPVFTSSLWPDAGYNCQ